MNFDVNGITFMNSEIADAANELSTTSAKLQEEGTALANVVKSEDSNLSATFAKLTETLRELNKQASIIFNQLTEEFNKYVVQTITNQDQSQSEIENISNSLDEINEMLNTMSIQGN